MFINYFFSSFIDFFNRLHDWSWFVPVIIAFLIYATCTLTLGFFLIRRGYIRYQIFIVVLGFLFSWIIFGGIFYIIINHRLRDARNEFKKKNILKNPNIKTSTNSFFK